MWIHLALGKHPSLELDFSVPRACRQTITSEHDIFTCNMWSPIYLATNHPPTAVIRPRNDTCKAFRQRCADAQAEVKLLKVPRWGPCFQSWGRNPWIDTGSQLDNLTWDQNMVEHLATCMDTAIITWHVEFIIIYMNIHDMICTNYG